MGQLAWIAHPNDIGSCPQKHLYLRASPKDKWQYYANSQHSVPDNEHFTPGMATLSSLMAIGWELIPANKVIWREIDHDNTNNQQDRAN